MQIFPGGCRRYTALPPAEKAGVLEHLANLLESLPHPSIPRPRVDALTAELRAAAPVMAAIARRVDQARTALRLISARYYALARFGATQLSMLKRLWVARGLSEADVHRLIPHHPAKAPSEEA